MTSSSSSTSEMMAFRRPPSIAPQITNSITPPVGTSSYDNVETVLEPGRRSPPPGSSPPMRVSTSAGEHVLKVDLPGFTPDMVTISAKKGETLAVVADMWHSEDDCHHEWEVNFPPRDANMTSVRAKFAPSGVLTIHVPRNSDYFNPSRFY